MKERMLSEVPDSSLEAISLSANKNDIEWEEEGREFSFKGQMYDVIRSKIINGQEILFCSNDKKEEQLIQHMNDVTKSNHQDTGKNSTPPEIKLVFDFVAINNLAHLLFSLRAELADIHYDIALPGQFASIIVPPPRFNLFD